MGLKGRDFLRVADWSGEEITELLDLADELKTEHREYRERPRLPGRALGLVFDKPSLRTRVSFEVAIAQLGGYPVHLGGNEVGFGERESMREMGIVLSRYLDAIVVRTFSQALVDELAASASIPVVNGLTDSSHPLQALADAMTIRERHGRFEGVRVAWVGDGNNVCASLMVICAKLGMEIAVATPDGYEPETAALEAARAAGGAPLLGTDPQEAVRDAQVVVTDAWASMGQEAEHEQRIKVFADYQVNAALVGEAAPDAIVLHCLPAHVGEEITEEVLYSDQSAAFDEAANRLHTEKALLALIVE
jgi:ornithine carbamoyltransferase